MTPLAELTRILERSRMANPPVALDPAVQAFADATAGPPYVFDLGPTEGRRVAEELQVGQVARPDAEIQDLIVPGPPSGDVPVRIVRPQGAEGPLPAILYIHGSGWVLGNTRTHDRLIRELAVGTGAAVVFPSYSLSPEAQYPVAIRESYAVLRWIAERGADRQLDGSRVAIAGDSVGGNIATAVAILAKERSGPKLAAQVLFYPVTDARFDTASYRLFARGYFLRRDAMRWFWDQYIPDPAQRVAATASPLRATRRELEALPPTLVITAEADVVRDEGETYARRLGEAGVNVTATRYDGTIHDFVMLDALRETAAARGAIAQAIDHLNQALGTSAWSYARRAQLRLLRSLAGV